jgi:hypothetical protein
MARARSTPHDVSIASSRGPVSTGGKSNAQVDQNLIVWVKLLALHPVFSVHADPVNQVCGLTAVEPLASNSVETFRP